MDGGSSVVPWAGGEGIALREEIWRLSKRIWDVVGPAVGTVVGSHPENREKRKDVILTKNFENTFKGKVYNFDAPIGTKLNYKNNGLFQNQFSKHLPIFHCLANPPIFTPFIDKSGQVRLPKHYWKSHSVNLQMHIFTVYLSILIWDIRKLYISALRGATKESTVEYFCSFIANQSQTSVN